MLKELKTFFSDGGPIFMGFLSMIVLVILIVSSRTLIQIYTRKITNSEEMTSRINRVRSIGLFALIFGILGQLIGLFSAFRAVKMNEVEATPSLFTEGFKISMIPTIYGISIFSFSILVWVLLKRSIPHFIKK